MDKLAEQVNGVLYMLGALGALLVLVVVLQAWIIAGRKSDRNATERGIRELGDQVRGVDGRLTALEASHQRVFEIVAPLAPQAAPLPTYKPPPARESTEPAEPTYPTPPDLPRGTMFPGC